MEERTKLMKDIINLSSLENISLKDVSMLLLFGVDLNEFFIAECERRSIHLTIESIKIDGMIDLAVDIDDQLTHMGSINATLAREIVNMNIFDFSPNSGVPYMERCTLEKALIITNIKKNSSVRLDILHIPIIDQILMILMHK